MTDDQLADKPEEHQAFETPVVADQSSEDATGGPRGTLVPLVVLPLLMVLSLVVVIVFFGWLGLANDAPEELVARLQRADRSSFRAAVTLVQMLRDPDQGHLRRDERLARDLSRLLQDELAAGSLQDERIQLRSFLCRALGELDRNDVLSALLVAANTERDPREIEVRRSALEAIAQIAARQSAGSPSVDPHLLETLLNATRGSGSEERSAAREAQVATAAFALGVLDDDRAHARLIELLDDLSADVRFNAATGLARWGRVEAVPVLLEMLDPESDSLAATETTARQRGWRRQIVLRSALRSVESLWAAQSPLDWKQMRNAVHPLTRYPDDLNVQRQATLTMQALEASP
jgi:hypothetical protein